MWSTEIFARTILQDFGHPAQSWIWGLRRRGWWWAQWEGSAQAPARPAPDKIFAIKSKARRYLVQGIEEALEPDEVANHPEDPQEPHHSYRPHNLARLINHNMLLSIDLTPARLSSCSQVLRGLRRIWWAGSRSGRPGSSCPTQTSSCSGRQAAARNIWLYVFPTKMIWLTLTRWQRRQWQCCRWCGVWRALHPVHCSPQ